jgi:hypothetical protein
MFDNKKKKKKNKLSDDELINDIMLDVDIHIIRKGVYNQINIYIERFKNHCLNILKTQYNNNNRKLNVNIICMNKYIDNSTAIYLSKIRNKIYSILIDNLNKLKEEGLLKIFVDETLVLRFKEYEENITRSFQSHIVYSK